MTETAPREQSLAERYPEFEIVPFEGRVYGIPTRLARVDPTNPEQLRFHPAIVSAPTEKLLEVRLSGFDPAPFESEPIGSFEDYRLVRHANRIFGVPDRYDSLDLNWEEDRARDGVVSAESIEEVRERIRLHRDAAPVEFLGWLPTFKWFGNCGAHPQFGHTELPPDGYRFVRSRPEVPKPAAKRSQGPSLAWKAWRLATLPFRCAKGMVLNLRQFGIVQCVATLFSCLKLVVQLMRKTGLVKPTLRFVHSRHFRSQVMAPRKAELAFLTSLPQTYGQVPWVIEIEDSTTLFFPFLPNGLTADLDVKASPYYALTKALLESDSCRAILTHMRSTFDTLPVLFNSEIIAKKTHYAPLGVRLPERWQQHDDTEVVDMLFTNSWHQQQVGFYLRGGLDVLEAFEILHAKYPNLRLTLRTQLPRLDERYQRIVEQSWIRVIDRFLPAKELEELQRSTHIYLLPSARIHIVSVLQAMSYGQVVVGSDGWGVEEYLEHERTGLIVRGRAGTVSWMDESVGLLREDYSHLYEANPIVVRGIVEAVSRLMEDAKLRRRLGHAAREAVEDRFNLANWNDSLKRVFDAARNSHAG